MKRFSLLLMFVLVCAPVLAANTTVFVTGQYYGNYTRLYDYTLSVYNSTGIVTKSNVSSMTSNLTNITEIAQNVGSYTTLRTWSFYPEVISTTKTFYSIIECSGGTPGTGFFRLKINYLNGSSEFTEEKSDVCQAGPGGATAVAWTTNLTDNIPISSIEAQSYSTIGANTYFCRANSCSFNYSIPGYINFSLEPGTYLFYANDSRYAINSESRTIAGNYQNFTYTFYTTNSIYFQFIDETTSTIINTTTITGYITSDIYSTNFTTSNGTRYVDLLQPTNYTITYSATNYNTRTYFYELTNQSTTTLNLYLRPTNSSSILQINIIDQNLNAVQNVIIYQTVKNLSGTNYYTTETCETDVNGQCVMTADIATTTYRPTNIYDFLAYFNGTLRGSTGDTVLSSNVLNLQINTGTNQLVNFFQLNGLQYTNITFNNVTNIFSITVLDPYGNINNICLNTYMRTGSTYTQTGMNCSSGSSATITIYSNTSLGDETIARAVVYYNGLGYQIDEMSVPNETGGISYRTGYLIFVFLAVMLTMFLGVKFLATSAIMVLIGVAFILVRVSGSILPGIAVIGFIGMAIIIWMRMKGE